MQSSLDLSLPSVIYLSVLKHRNSYTWDAKHAWVWCLVCVLARSPNVPNALAAYATLSHSLAQACPCLRSVPLRSRLRLAHALRADHVAPFAVSTLPLRIYFAYSCLSPLPAWLYLARRARCSPHVCCTGCLIEVCLAPGAAAPCRASRRLALHCSMCACFCTHQSTFSVM